MDVAEARRIERPSWINLRTTLGLVLFCGAIVVGRQMLATGPPVDLVWSAARDLPAGAVVGASDVVPVEVTFPGATLSHYILSDRDLVGTVLLRPIAEGELVAATWLSDGAPATRGRVMTIPIAPEHAVGGRLRPGDLVDVYATFDSGDVRARTTLLARGIEVVEVVTAGGFAIDEESIVGLTVSITPDTAGRLAFAIRSGEIDVVKVTGATIGGTRSTVSGDDLP